MKKRGTDSSRPSRPRSRVPSCSFERIYFSRGNDLDIYARAQGAGRPAVPNRSIRSIGHDWTNTVFSFIPNTAEVAYYGLMSALRERRRDRGEGRDPRSAAGRLTEAVLDDLILRNWPRGEKVVSKDIKLRTFIGQESMRNQLASHVYDITYGSVKPGDNLVCVDDSIVRGTTLRKSILRILARLQPKKIVIVSTAPQIRYPDCYGIDMSELGKFIAFEAAVDLLKERGQGQLLQEVYRALPRRGRQAGGDDEPCAEALRAVHPGGDLGQDRRAREAEGHRVEGRDRDHLPDDREPARRGAAASPGRLVFHRANTRRPAATAS
jgi:amidophosphoribosyltransferase